MKMLFTYPVFLFVVLFAVACGKQDSANPGVAAAPAAAVPTPPAPTPIPSPIGSDLRNYCASQIGLMNADGTLCVISLVNYYGYQLRGAVKIGAVYATDQIAVITSKSPQPRVYIGDGIQPNVEYPTNAAFVAGNSGTLLVRGEGNSLYRLKEVQIRRCVNQSMQVVACP